VNALLEYVSRLVEVGQADVVFGERDPHAAHLVGESAHTYAHDVAE
jgi:hypothetical protein